MISDAVEHPSLNIVDTLKKSLTARTAEKEIFQLIADAPFTQQPEAAFLFLGFISFFLVDNVSNVVKLAAVSDTELYKQSVKGYTFKPSEFSLSLDDDSDNDIVRAIVTGKKIDTSDWKSLSRQDANTTQTRLNQASGGIAYNAIYPLKPRLTGALLFCYFQYQENIGDHQNKFMRDYAAVVSDVIKNMRT